ncbi:carboxypeptidase-like regulatory domain-containing protein [Myxococcus sp. K15C18031901]|uniref:MSCRAMM family protein n=1 Tax=Myxococcus dinghuensis TaxID=2906761 RepID=UPI0020A82A1C|nr:carboxypeptidase-like regulatory domain-containing protein [Myxococcus dinghuensis]MCP3100197.1 carboxypeptidase-like regulatory domain-containing protein [Myxococcus dinghuensis]
MARQEEAGRSGGGEPQRIPHTPSPVIWPEPPTVDGVGDITVQVVSATTQARLEGVAVALVDAAKSPVLPDWDLKAAMSTTTDVTGTASLRNVPAGVYHLCAQGAGHAEVCEQNLGLVARGKTRLVLSLPEGATLRGVVRGPDGVGMPGVDLELGQWVASMTMHAVTDARGGYAFKGVSPGAVWVVPRTEEGDGERRTTDIPEGARDVPLDISLRPFTQVTFIPVPARGPRRPVELFMPDAVLARDEEGHWQGRVESGLRELAVNGPDVEYSRRKLMLDPGAPNVIRVSYSRVTSRPFIWAPPMASHVPGGYELAGHVAREDGVPVDDFYVSVPERWDGVMRRRCGNSGRNFQRFRFGGSGFVVHPQAEQPQVIYVWTADGRAGSLSLPPAAEHERVVANILLQETGGVTGRLVARDDLQREEFSRQAFVNEERFVVDNRWLGPTFRLDGDGVFILAGLAPGEHHLGGLLSEGEDPSESTRRVTILPGFSTQLGLIPLAPGGPAPPLLPASSN